MNLSSLIQRHRTSGAKLTSIAVAVALVGQLVLGSFAQAAVINSNKVGTDMTAFQLDHNAVFAQSISGQQSGAGSFANGSVSDYPEGSCIPGLVKVKNNDNVAGDIVFSPNFDYLNGVVGIDHLEAVTSSLGSAVGTADDLSDLTLGLADLSTVTSFTTLSGGSVTAVITGPVSNGTNGGTQMKKYDVTLQNVPAGETVLFLTCARLGDNASEFSGATLSMRLSGGKENIGISTKQLLVLPSLTLVKQVVGGDASADQWSFNVSPSINNQTNFPTTLNQDGTASVTIDNIPVDGSYSITESGPSGYTPSAGSGNANCTFSGSTATATIAAGDPATDATCVFVNTYNAPPAPTTGSVTVTKVVVNDDGGTSVVSDFPLSVGQTSVTSGQANDFAPGDYVVSEGGPSGYAGTFTGDCDAQGNLTVHAGGTYSCTLTNDDIAPRLTVTKVVVNDDQGTSQVSDFPLFVGATQVTSGAQNAFDAGSYAVTESGPSGYAGTFSGDCDQNGNVTLALGEVKSCTLTNNDIAPEPTTGTITVVKVVSGGDAQVSDFPLYVGDTQVTSGETNTFNAGTYVVSEQNNQPNYVGSFSGDCDQDGLMTLGADRDLTCTITNTYVPPAPNPGSLTVIKHVINDNGGTAVAADFTMNVTGTNVSNASFPGSEDGTNVTLDAGEYSVNESAASGYAVSYSEGCSGTMSADGSATCTVTNDDIAPPPNEGPSNGTLTVVKVVINDDSGTKQVSDFPLFVGQTQVTSGQANSFEPGSYTVSETSDAGYVASFSGDCDASGIVSLESGDEKTCTITNDDVRQTDGGGGNPSTGLLIVVTNVINDDGGSALPAHFLMTVTSGSPSVFAGQGTPGMSLSTLPGAYSVDGSNDPGYAKSAGPNCTGTLSANQTVTCVITYDDLPAAGGEPTPPTPPETPTPEVLGATDSATGPVPMVLGATDEDLPVTGMPAWALIAFLLPAAPFLRRKRA